MYERWIERTTGLFVLTVASSIAAAGGITGTVVFDGEAPSLKPVRMEGDPACHKLHDGPVASDILVLGEGNTMANIFVRVKSGLADESYAPPDEPAVLDQRGCRYVPHVLGLMVGQTLRIKNSDGLLHNVHSLPKINKAFNRAMPSSVTETEFVFDEEEFTFKIKCDVHPWMGAHIGVLAHPFFDVTAEDGRFTIDGLPPGSYEIEAWHEKLPAQTRQVTLLADEIAIVDFTLSKPPRR